MSVSKVVKVPSKAKFHRMMIDLRNHPCVEKIKSNIRFDNYSDFDWNQGGCFAFAEAVTSVVPDAELWVVATKDWQVNEKGEKEFEDWASQHAVIKYKQSFYDAYGLHSEIKLIKEYGNRKGAKLGKVSDWVDKEYPNALWYPEQEFVVEGEIELIGQTLLEIMG